MKRLLIVLVVLAILLLSALFGGFPGLAIGAVAAAIIVLCYLIAGWLGFARGMLFLALILSVAMGIFAGGNLGVGLPGEIIQGREALFLAAGAVGGFVLWLLIILAALFLSADLILAIRGGDLWGSFVYLVTSLLLERAGDLQIVDNGEVRTIKTRGLLAPFSAIGYVIINHGNAVVFEHLGHPSQVAPPSLVVKKPFERIRAVVDLRMQVERRTETFYTKDGIPLGTDIEVYFQIDAGGRRPTREDMHPFSEQAVLNAVFGVPEWKAYTTETALALLRAILCRYYLDEIYPLKELALEEQAEAQVSKQGVVSQLHQIAQELQETLSDVALHWGVRIHRVDIDVVAPDEIKDRALAFEKTRTEEQIAHQKAAAESARIKEFVAQTGGRVSDYAVLRYLERIGEAGIVPPSLDRMLLEAIQESLRPSAKK